MIIASSGSLFWALMFGAIGMGYFVYGKQQRHPVALFSGILLCVYPYFVSNVVYMLLVGAALAAAPFVVRSG